MKRREFITLLGGAAAWPLAARAQQGERMRRIGVLHTPAADDRVGQARNAAFLQRLGQLGWTDGRNIRIETRWGGSEPERTRRSVQELVALATSTYIDPSALMMNGCMGWSPPRGKPETIVSAEPLGTMEPAGKEYRTMRSLISA